jgi:hypothetical protein
MRSLRFLPLTCLFAITLSADGGDKKGPSLEDDFRALKGIWTRDAAKTLTEVDLAPKEFPKLRVKVSRLDPFGKGLKAVLIYEGDALLQEKEGKRYLAIENGTITYALEKEKSFLNLKGEFAHKKMKINLTGTWGETVVKMP